MNPFSIFLILALISRVFSLDLARLLGIRRNWSDNSETEDPEIVEIIRWRQPVCIVPETGVKSCYVSLRKYQNDFEKNTEGVKNKSSEEKEAVNGNGKNVNKKRRMTSWLEEEEDNAHDGVTKIITPTVTEKLSIESSEGSDHVVSIHSSTPGLENARGRRQGRYLVISRRKDPAIDARPPSSVGTQPTISVTKVLNSPVTATLVAKNCFPDLGVPMCHDYQETLTIYKDPVSLGNRRVPNKVENAKLAQDRGDQHSEETSETSSERSREKTCRKCGSSLDGPDIHETNYTTSDGGYVHVVANKPFIIEKPSLNPESTENHPTIVIATQQTPTAGTAAPTAAETAPTITTAQPGFISNFLNIQKPSILSHFGLNLSGKKNKTTEGTATATVTINPIIHKPNLTNLYDHDKTESIKGKPPVTVQIDKDKPGFLGNLWNHASHHVFTTENVQTTTEKVQTTTENVQTTTENVQSTTKNVSISGNDGTLIFVNITTTEDVVLVPKGSKETLAKNITKSTVDKDKSTGVLLENEESIVSGNDHRPLVVERPGAKPLLIENPIYLKEKPPRLGQLFNIDVHRNTNESLVDHEVIQRPVYVYKNPPTSGSGGISDFFQGWIVREHELSSEETSQTVAVENSSSKTTKGNGENAEIAEENTESIAENSELVAENIKLTAENAESATVDTRLVAENTKLAAENSELVAENTKLAAENAESATVDTRLVAENTELAAENTELVAENTELTAENTELSAENRELAIENAELAAENTELPADNLHTFIDLVKEKSENVDADSGSTVAAENFEDESSKSQTNSTVETSNTEAPVSDETIGKIVNDDDTLEFQRLADLDNSSEENETTARIEDTRTEETKLIFEP